MQAGDGRAETERRELARELATQVLQLGEPSDTVACGSVRSSSADPWVSVLVCDASSPVSRDITASAWEASDQSAGSSSITSSSTPTVQRPRRPAPTATTRPAAVSRPPR